MKALSFEGHGAEYFKIWIVNILLIIVTLGLYYPWAKVRNNRYIYGNSTLENRNFDYHATGKQLFIGYLISMGLLIAYITIQQVSPTGGVIVLLLFLLGLPWIIWRSLKFNMRVTSFSNVRFGFDGNLGGSYINYMLLPILAFLALYSGPLLTAVFVGVGLSLPKVIIAIIFIIGFALAIYLFGYLKKRNASYVIDGSRYGQGKFSSNLEVAEFIKILFKTVGLSILISVGFMILIGFLAYILGVSSGLLEMAGSLDDPEAIQGIMQSPGVIGLLAMFYIGFIIISILIFSYQYTRQRAYIFANSELDNKIKLESTLKARSLVWISLTNFLVIVLTLGLAIPWATVRITRFVLENTKVDTSVGLEEYVTQKQNEQSSLGEQIGDAFDVDVGLGI